VPPTALAASLIPALYIRPRNRFSDKELGALADRDVVDERLSLLTNADDAPKRISAPGGCTLLFTPDKPPDDLGDAYAIATCAFRQKTNLLMR
jgi:hypothetical protein